MRSVKTSVDGIVIWQSKTGEADRVITLLTEHGLITAYARSSLRPKNKLTSPTSMLSFSNFELRSGKNMYSVEDALIKERFIQLNTDIARYSAAVYFCELLKQVAPIDDDASAFMSLLLNSLYLLNEGIKNILLVKSVFELRAMSLSGYMPDLEVCASCGREESERLFFDILNGVWYCESCARNGVKPMNCTGVVLRALRHIIYADKGKAFSFEISDAGLNQLSMLASNFVTSHLERSLTTREFLNSILES